MTTQDVIRKLTIRATGEGIEPLTTSLKGLASATGAVVQITDTSAKRAISAEAAWNKLNLSLDPNARAQLAIAKATKVASDALAQGIITQERYNKAVSDVTAKYTTQIGATAAIGKATEALQLQMASLAGGMGATGSILTAFGPWGFAASAALGLMTAGFHQAAAAATILADRAGKLKDFAETTGFTVLQLQALEKAGAQVGVSSESVSKALEKFSVAMDDIKKGKGGVYESILEVDKGLAKQLLTATNLAEAWDLVAKATKAADLEQANKLSRSIFGRSGVEITRLQGANVGAGGIAALTADMNKLDAITAKQAETWDTLGDNINENMKAAKQNISSIFTTEVLEGVERFSKAFLDVTRAMKEFTLGEDFRAFLEWSKTPVGMAVLAGGAGAIAGGAVAGPVGALVGGATMGTLGVARGAQYEQQTRVKITGGTMMPPPEQYGPTAEEMAESIKAIEDQKKALEAQKTVLAQSISEQERWSAALGAAVTPAQTLKLGIDKLQMAFLENKISAEQLQKAQGSLNSAYTTTQFAAYISLLGQSVTIEEQVRIKRDQISEAAKRGISLTKEQISTQERLIVQNALGITQVVAHRQAIEIEAATLGMSAGQAYAYQVVQEKINDAKRRGVEISGPNLAMLEREAVLTGKAIDSAARFRQINDLAGNAASGFLQDVAGGADKTEAMAKAMKSVANSVIDIATKQLVGNMLGDLLGSTASQTAGATSSATILTTAGVTLAASMVAGATEAAAILGVGSTTASTQLAGGGAAAGTEVASGGLAAQIALITGADAASVALYGPMALLLCAVGAIGSLRFEETLSEQGIAA